MERQTNFYGCSKCNAHFDSEDKLQRHYSECHKTNCFAEGTFLVNSFMRNKLLEKDRIQRQKLVGTGVDLDAIRQSYK